MVLKLIESSKKKSIRKDIQAMGTKEMYCSLQGLRVWTGEIKMAIDSFMTSVNRGEKYPWD